MHANDRPESEQYHQTIDLRSEPKSQCVRLHKRAELRLVQEKIEAIMRVTGYPRRDIFAIKLVLGEAAYNAFRHGNCNDSSKHVDIRYLILANEVFVEVEDQGFGFNPYHVPFPLIKGRLGGTRGRGLFLMQAYTSWLRFNSWGNQVTMCRRRSVLSGMDSKP